MPPIAGIVPCIDRAPTERAAQPASPVRLYLVLPAGARPQGPATLTNLRAMVIDGRVDASALVSAMGSDHWRPLAELLADPPPVHGDAPVASNQTHGV